MDSKAIGLYKMSGCSPSTQGNYLRVTGGRLPNEETSSKALNPFVSALMNLPIVAADHINARDVKAGGSEDKLFCEAAVL